MDRKVSELIQRARHIIKTDGIVGLVKRSYRYFSPMIFAYGRFYLYEIELKDWEENSCKSKLDNVDCKIIRSNEEADNLATEYEDFRDMFFDARDRLNKGGIAVCLYVGRDFANISWLAITQAARNCCDSLPYRVDFSGNMGGIFTIPKLRGENLMTYLNYRQFQFLEELGITSVCNAIRTNNGASQSVYKKIGA